MTFVDRIVVAAISFMYVALPLYGTFEILDPVRLPIPSLVGRTGAIGIALVMLAAAAICVFGAFRRRAPRFVVIAQLLPGLGIVPAALLGFDPQTGLELALLVFAMGAVGIALCGYAALPGATRTVVIATLASATCASVTALVMTWTRTPAALYAYDNGRAVGTFLNPNELAAYLLVILGLAAGVAFYTRALPLRLLAGTTLISGAIALAASYSRWGFVAAVAGALVFALAVRGRRVWIALGVLTIAAAILIAGPGQQEEEHHNPRDDTSRVVAWATGVGTGLAFPFSGVGPFAYRRTYDVFRPPEAPGGEAPVAFDPHSLPLAYFDESGLIGFALLLCIWAVYAREIPLLLRSADARRRAVVYALAGGLIALQVHVLVNTISIYFVFITQGPALALALAQRDLDAPAA